MEVREVDVSVYACEVGDSAYWGDGGGYCGTTYSGVQVGPGVAACSWGMELGTVFLIEGDPTGRVYVCLDRGAQVGSEDRRSISGSRLSRKEWSG